MLDAITRDLKASASDHIAVTGDLVNFSLPRRIRAGAGVARNARDAGCDVTVIPGNHDVYVPRSEQSWPAEYWGDYMRGDDGAQPGSFRSCAGADPLR